ncbi:hypothetical protein [Myxococcus xanthus]|uniref:Uncharacterized protein n=1 Tax=Myxococcus xanthus TaxID=34 RepID=A0A7Y4ICL1_MYXXA|nr:hypothetical protein [Myxococcus xanthus]NOJ76786.1 hypothetical protein [Myxococcus xanthus]NOJ84245.1 hypothetical protein [Myxococcus xanthus]
MAGLAEAKMQLRQCLVASKNRRDLQAIGVGYAISSPNFPDTNRLSISEEDFKSLKKYFLDDLASDLEFSFLYPDTEFAWEVASSGSTRGVQDFKISPRTVFGSGTAIFNYHIGVA